MEEITTLARAAPAQASLRTVLPMSIIKHFELKVGDRLEWEWHETKDKDKMMLVVRKAKKK